MDHPFALVDDTLGTQIVRQINDQLIKWCEAFLDEGHATWVMPEREKGLYQAWKTIAAHEWSPCGIADSGRKIAALPDWSGRRPLGRAWMLGHPGRAETRLFIAPIDRIAGLGRFHKWRGEELDYPWQQAYPAGLVKFLAIRLWYARELVQKACREELGIEGRYEAVTVHAQPSRGVLLATTAGGRAIAGPVRRGSGSAGPPERQRVEGGARSLSDRSGSTTGGGGVARRGKNAADLGRIAEIDPEQLVGTAPGNAETDHPLGRGLSRVGSWSGLAQGLEASYQETLLGQLRRPTANADGADKSALFAVGLLHRRAIRTFPPALGIDRRA